ncbi:SDR family NAD(P)-dependent oxidoreductase [Luteibacter aegosomatissinici]|uniref:SDR family NAD(P)-dependent oxidoreductase n=1 Tax=Luteibacter aegosomatissinici TaxID=2911539 RepID=UPI001FFA8F1E|nr:SDR family oxidoreductase [Luteibacter aegosomatissinici]UPG92758.1 SDR family oxidoreductase [Luteibacter aegosomatissinici]
MNTESKGTALVTGASSGIGAVYAERLAARGYDLILVARRADRLGELAGRLRDATGRRAEILQADLSKAEDLARVEQRVIEDESLTLLVNNAGISLQGGVLENSSAAIAELIAVNVTAPSVLTASAIKRFLARNRGGVINIASVLALAPEILEGLYSGSKAHLLNLTRGVALHLKDTNVRIQAVLPGATKSEIWDKAGIDVDTALPGMVMETADLVDAALLGFDRGEVVTIPPLHDEEMYLAYDQHRLGMAEHLSKKEVAQRYRAA